MARPGAVKSERKPRQIQLEAEMRAFAALGLETADDFGVAAHTQMRITRGGEIGPETARVATGKITGALAVNLHGDGLIVVGIVVLRREDGVGRGLFLG